LAKLQEINTRTIDVNFNQHPFKIDLLQMKLMIEMKFLLPLPPTHQL